MNWARKSEAQMTPRRARLALLWMFVGCLILQCGVLFLDRSAVWPEDLVTSLLTLLKIYSVPLAVILGSLFARPRATTSASPGICWAALLLAACWNLLLVWRTVACGFATEDSVSDLTKYLEAVSSAGSF